QVAIRELAQDVVRADGESAARLEVVWIIRIVGLEEGGRGRARAAAREAAGRIARIRGGQRARTEIAAVLRDRVQGPIAYIYGRVAAPVRRVDGGDEREVLRVSVGHVVPRQLEAAVPDEVRDRAVVLVLVEAVLRIDPYAFEV